MGTVTITVGGLIFKETTCPTCNNPYMIDKMTDE